LVLTPPLGGVFIWGKYGRTSINFILDSFGGHMGRITSFSKQVIVFFLVTALIIRPTFAANVGGWTLGGGVAQGASTVYEGTKKVVIDGVDYIKKGTAKITPPASQVAKVLARGAAGYALSVAVEQLLGSVDWVLDPANNQIVYTKPQDPTKVPPDSPVCWTWNGGTCKSFDAIVQDIIKTNVSGWTIKSKSCPSYATVTTPGVRVNCNVVVSYPGWNDMTVIANPLSVANPNYDPTAENENEEKRIPLETVAQKVISNAESGDTRAQAATTAAAADIVAEAEKDSSKAPPIVQQLESSAQTKPADEAAAEKANEAQGQSKPNTQNPEAMDLSLEFPVFCGWAPLVCEAAQVVISFPQTLTNWWETGKSKAEEWANSISEAWTKVKEEYADKPEENTDTELDIPDLSDESIDSDISFGGSCPAPLSSDINFMGLNKTIEFSFDPVCQIAEFIKPVVISISAFSAALIVAGIRTEDD
jgi:hypothetical protein